MQLHSSGRFYMSWIFHALTSWYCVTIDIYWFENRFFFHITFKYSIHYFSFMITCFILVLRISGSDWFLKLVGLCYWKHFLQIDRIYEISTRIAILTYLISVIKINFLRNASNFKEKYLLKNYGVTFMVKFA